MKNILKKAVVAAIIFSLMFVIPAVAVEPSESLVKQDKGLPSEIAFQIPMNHFCSNENSFDFSFQISNTSDKAADIILYLYGRDGNEFNEQGGSYNGIESTILPGTPFTLKGHATGLYHINFGNQKQCNERIYSGKIAANSGQVSLLAKGWININKMFEIIRTDTITINDNKSFDLASFHLETEKPSQ